MKADDIKEDILKLIKEKKGNNDLEFSDFVVYFVRLGNTKAFVISIFNEFKIEKCIDYSVDLETKNPKIVLGAIGRKIFDHHNGSYKEYKKVIPFKEALQTLHRWFLKYKWARWTIYIISFLIVLQLGVKQLLSIDLLGMIIPKTSSPNNVDTTPPAITIKIPNPDHSNNRNEKPQAGDGSNTQLTPEEQKTGTIKEKVSTPDKSQSGVPHSASELSSDKFQKDMDTLFRALNTNFQKFKGNTKDSLWWTTTFRPSSASESHIWEYSKGSCAFVATFYQSDNVSTAEQKYSDLINKFSAIGGKQRPEQRGESGKYIVIEYQGSFAIVSMRWRLELYAVELRIQKDPTHINID